MKEKPIFVLMLRTTPEKMDIRGTASILKQVDKSYKVYIACSQKYLAKTNKIKVKEFDVNNLTLKEDLILDLSQVVAMITRTSIPEWFKKNNPNLVLINNNKLRAFSSKSKQSKIPFYVPTMVVTEDKLINEKILATLGGDEEYVVLKPDMGASSSNVIKVRKNVAAINLAIKKIRFKKSKGDLCSKNKPVLIQRFMPPTAIKGLRPNTLEDAKKLERAKNAIEIRVYIHSGKSNIPLMHCVGRWIEPWGGEGRVTSIDEWISIDQSSIPNVVFSIADKIARKIKKDTESDGMFIAVDLFKSIDGKFIFRELNVKNPAIPKDFETFIDNAKVCNNYAIFLKELLKSSKN